MLVHSMNILEALVTYQCTLSKGDELLKKEEGRGGDGVQHGSERGRSPSDDGYDNAVRLYVR